jgi:hypothetical protein
MGREGSWQGRNMVEAMDGEVVLFHDAFILHQRHAIYKADPAHDIRDLLEGWVPFPLELPWICARSRRGRGIQ